MAKAELFAGIAVVIDDELANNESSISKIRDGLKAHHCPVLEFTQLPDANFRKHLQGASFFVVDWNLHNADVAEGVRIPAAAKTGHAKEITDFLKELQAIRFAPVFIFTAEDKGEVSTALKKAGLIKEGNAEHILVKNKDEVLGTGVFEVLTEWLEQVPSAYVLKQWEKEYDQARNSLFLDFYTSAPEWPLVLWKSFCDDGVSPSSELGGLLGRNLVSRMAPFNFELAPYLEAQERSGAAPPRESVMKVLEGERFIPESRLHPNSISSGDLFKKNGDYYLNIRPDCDCIAREGANQDDVELYFLKGDQWSAKNIEANFQGKYGNFSERDTEAVVLAIHDGKTVAFKFADLFVGRWGEWKDKRKGRLLAPYVTRIQQRYSGYIQRPGLTRIPEIAIQKSAVQTAAAASKRVAATRSPTHKARSASGVTRAAAVPKRAKQKKR